jgi:hypothetical protein
VRQDGTFRAQAEVTASPSSWFTIDGGAAYSSFALDAQDDVFALRHDGVLFQLQPGASSFQTVSRMVYSFSIDDSGQLVIDDWFQRNLADAGLRSVVRSDFARDGAITGADMLDVFVAAEGEGVVSASEVTTLEEVLANPATLQIPAYVQYLTGKVVNGDPANATTHQAGGEAGNLFAGCDARRLGTLVGKWFLGSDLPALTNLHGENPVGYANFPIAGNPSGGGFTLFNGGPSYQDVYQGAVGDCTLMAATGETAFRTSAIATMFIANGDGTYTLRFFDNGTPVYVTVNTELPVNSSGQLVYAQAAGNVIWVPLLEKGYAQLNESGWLGTLQPGSNSYWALDNGDAKTAAWALAALSGRAGWYYPSSINADQVLAEYNAGQLVVLGTSNAGGPYVVHNHAYAVVGTNSDGTFILFNPWGIWNSQRNTYPGLIQANAAAINTYFSDWAFTAAAPTLQTPEVGPSGTVRSLLLAASDPSGQDRTRGTDDSQRVPEVWSAEQPTSEHGSAVGDQLSATVNVALQDRPDWDLWRGAVDEEFGSLGEARSYAGCLRLS